VAADSLVRDVGETSTQRAVRIVETATFLGLTAGAGVSVVATQHLSIDGEFKVLYMRGHNGQWARIGVGLSYRF
jgi:opacity protein-like surface antigen